MKVTSGNARLATESQGSGSPDVLMIHAGVTDQRSWRHVIDRLPDHRCLTYDQRGYGRTTYTAEDGWSQVDDAVTVLDAYEVASAIVVGCSMGGRGALDLALSHPDRVQALVLIGSAVSGAPPLEGEPGLEDLEKQYDAAYDAHDLAELNRLEAWIWLDGPHQPEGRVGGAARELFLDMNRLALEARETGDERHDVNAWEHCGEIRVPTLVLIGEHDLDHTHGNATHLAEQIPGARLVRLPGVAHLPHLEADERTLSEISGFVAGI